MKFITTEEFFTMKVYELDDVTYKRIERAFVEVLGYKIAAHIMEKFMEKTIREFTLNSWVDVMSLLTII